MDSARNELSNYIKQELSNIPCPKCQQIAHEVTSLTVHGETAMATIYCNVLHIEEEVRVYLEYV